jgi:hypothetical protein
MYIKFSFQLYISFILFDVVLVTRRFTSLQFYET